MEESIVSTIDPLYSPVKEMPITVLLIDDQRIIAEAVRRILAEHSDIAFHYCADPSDAIKIANQVHPTVILQDLVMAEIDGLTLIKYLRANPLTKDVPLIVLSVKEDPKIKAEVFAHGANDYVVKLPDKQELVARIRYHSSGYTRLLQRNEAYGELEKSRALLVQELAEAAQYVRSLLPKQISSGKILTKWFFFPSAQLGGDAFNYHWIDQEHFAVYLLDVCGHGVGAALLSVTVLNVLQNQSLADTNFLDPTAVLHNLNETFPMEAHNNMFFTMWYGVFNIKQRTLRYASGGHPPAFLISDKGKKIQELFTPNVVVGGMPGIKFKSASCKVPHASFLYVFSDGIYEHSKDSGKMFEVQDFAKAICNIAKRPLDEQIKGVERFVKKIGGAPPYPDDISLIIAQL